MNLVDGVGVLMKATCLIRVEFPDSSAAKSAKEALLIESEVGKRAATHIINKGNILEVKIVGEDIVASRAAANTALRALQVFEGIEV